VLFCRDVALTICFHVWPLVEGHLFLVLSIFLDFEGHVSNIGCFNLARFASFSK
jgi:hypothetical protein